MYVYKSNLKIFKKSDFFLVFFHLVTTNEYCNALKYDL